MSAPTVILQWGTSVPLRITYPSANLARAGYELLLAGVENLVAIEIEGDPASRVTRSQRASNGRSRIPSRRRIEPRRDPWGHEQQQQTNCTR